jgi:hypothetical protein
MESEVSSAQPLPPITHPLPTGTQSKAVTLAFCIGQCTHGAVYGCFADYDRTHEPVYFQFASAAITVVIIARGWLPLPHEHPRLGGIRSLVGLKPLRE